MDKDYQKTLGQEFTESHKTNQVCILRLLSLDDYIDDVRKSGKALDFVLQALRDGYVSVALLNGKYIGFCCVIKQGKIGVLGALPSNKYNAARLALKDVDKWCTEQGITQLVVSVDKFNGSTFRYFEKTLGLKKMYLTFGKFYG